MRRVNKKQNAIMKHIHRIVENLDIHEYHAGPEMSASNLMKAAVSCALADHDKKTPKDSTPAMLNGTMIHTAIETRDPGAYYVVEPEGINKRTKAGKEELAEFAASVGDKIVVSASQWEMANRTMEAAWAHPEAKLFLDGAKFERSGFCELLGVTLKARPDLDCADFSGDLVDIKSRQLGKAGAEAWLKDFFNYKTYIQAGLQIKIWRELGYEVRGYYYLLVETEPPYQVNVVGLDEEWIHLAIVQTMTVIQKWRDWLDAGKPAGYGNYNPLMEVPGWMRSRLE